MPTSANVHVSGSLTNVAINYAGGAGFFVLEQAATIVPVGQKANPFRTFVKEDFYRIQAGVRGTNGMYPRVDYRLSSDTYSCISKGLGVPVADESLENADPAVDPDRDATLISTQGCMRQFEYDVATAFTGSTWTAGSAISAAGTPWNGADGGSIKADLDAVVEQVHDSIGMPPSMLTGIMSWTTYWKGVRRNPVVRDFIKARTDMQIVTAADLAEFSGVSRWIIVPGMYNSASESAAGTAFTSADIWNASVFVGYLAPSPSILMPSALYTFQFRPLRTKVYREEAPAQKVVEVDKSYDVKQCAADAGQLITSTIA